MQAGSAARGRDGAELSRGLQEAIVELRQLVDGVVPASLTERGLYAAAAELTDRMPIPVELDFEPLPAELPVGVENGRIFRRLRGLLHVVKHSAGRGAPPQHHPPRRRPAGSRSSTTGVGGAHLGGGLRGLADRVDALSGRAGRSRARRRRHPDPRRGPVR